MDAGWRALWERFHHGGAKGAGTGRPRALLGKGQEITDPDSSIVPPGSTGIPGSRDEDPVVAADQPDTSGNANFYLGPGIVMHKLVRCARSRMMRCATAGKYSPPGAHIVYEKTL